MPDRRGRGGLGGVFGVWGGVGVLGVAVGGVLRRFVALCRGGRRCGEGLGAFWGAGGRGGGAGRGSWWGFSRRPGDAAPQAHRGVHNRPHTQAPRQRPRRQQARISDQRLVVEDHREPIQTVRYSTHRKCLSIRANNPFQLRLFSQVREALPRIYTPQHPNPFGGSRLNASDGGNRHVRPGRVLRTEGLREATASGGCGVLPIWYSRVRRPEHQRTRCSSYGAAPATGVSRGLVDAAVPARRVDPDRVASLAGGVRPRSRTDEPFGVRGDPATAARPRCSVAPFVTLEVFSSLPALSAGWCRRTRSSSLWTGRR